MQRTVLVTLYFLVSRLVAPKDTYTSVLAGGLKRLPCLCPIPRECHVSWSGVWHSLVWERVCGFPEFRWLKHYSMAASPPQYTAHRSWVLRSLSCIPCRTVSCARAGVFPSLLSTTLQQAAQFTACRRYGMNVYCMNENLPLSYSLCPTLGFSWTRKLSG